MKSCRRSQLSKTTLRLCAAVSAAVAVIASSGSAVAEESPYCRKVRAHAAADAAIFEGPSVLAEAIKAPSGLQPGGKLDPTTPGAGYQIRAGFSFSPLDFYKGTRVTVVADADCEAHEKTVTAQQLIIQAPELGRLVALREQAEYLDAQRANWEGVAARMSERFSAQTATLVELEAIRAQTATIARQRAQVAGEIARIEANGLPQFTGSITALISDIREKTMKMEREASHVRSLDAWKFNITGGYLPPIYGGGGGDFFGVVQLGYNIGGPWHNAAEGRYLSARDEELQKQRYELGHQLEILRNGVKAATTQASRELEIVDKRLAEIDSLRTALGTSEAPAAAFALARLDIDRVSTQADRVFLTGLIRELSRLETN